MTQTPLPSPGRIFGGVAVEGGGWILVGNRVIPIPPREPVFAIVEEILVLLESRLIASPVARIAVQREALSAIAERARSLLGA